MSQSGSIQTTALIAPVVTVLDKRGDVQYHACGGCGERVNGNVCPRCLRSLIGTKRVVQ